MITPISYTFKYFYSEIVFVYSKNSNILLEALVSSMLTYSSFAELHHNTACESGSVAKLIKDRGRVDDNITPSKKDSHIAPFFVVIDSATAARICK